MLKKIANRHLKISQGKTEIDRDLAVGTYDIEVRVKGDIVKEEYNDNQDGSVNVTYVLKAYELEVK